MKLFDKNQDVYIIIEHDTDEAVRLAAIDLQRNLCQLSGKTDGFNIVNGDHQCGIFIKTVENEEHEAYTVNVDENKVTIVGSDILGTVFGIFAFATKCLNISPVYRLTDIFPESMGELILKTQSFSSGDRPVGFRGWFLNDEDLLTDFKISGGHRHIDYPFYQNVMDVDVLDMILETALRLEINLVIPSSFVDIDNPNEEKLVEAVCRRGLYISQHHVEPMGVSYFAADNYMKQYGHEGEVVSFITNRDRMIEIWRYYAEKWSKYGEHVIWQLGLRGKADQAVWKVDPSVSSSMEGRGAIISDAIGTQYDIIHRVLGTDDFHSTATLWNEGSELYGKGFLRLPQNTIPVFSDFGIDQMFGEDLFSIGHKMEGQYGIYCHAGFWAMGPHLADGCSPEKMAYNYRNAATDGQIVYIVKYLFRNKHHVGGPDPDGETRQNLIESAKRFLLLLKKAENGEKQISSDRHMYYKQFVKYPVLYMYLLTEWCIACIDLKNENLSKEERRQRGRFACSCLERILTERKVLEQGDWESWHRGDKKIDIPMFLERTEKICGEV